MAFYLAGPMRGLPNSNFDSFAEAREHLRGAGYAVICPVEAGEARLGEIVPADDKNFYKQMHHCYNAVLESEGVIVLPGWGRSEGAKAEVLVAVTTGKPIYAYHKHRPHFLEELPNVKITTRAEVLA
jgi:hypothetical protein